MFQSPAEFGRYLQNLIDRHREDLSIILRRRGVRRKVDPFTLLLAFEAYGDDFIRELAELPEEMFNAKEAFSQLKDIFEQGKEIVTGIKGSTSGSGAPPADQPPAADEPKPWTTKRIVTTGAIIIAVLIIVLIVLKKLKS